MSAIHRYFLPDITCVLCVEPIAKALKKAQKKLRFTSFSIDHDKKELTIIMPKVTYSPHQLFKSVHETLDAIGVECVNDVDENLMAPVKKKPSKHFWGTHWFLGFVGTLTGMTVLMLSLFVSAMPFAALIGIACVSVPLTLILGATSYKEAVKKFFKTGALTMDTLFAISTLTVIIVSVTAFFVPWLPMMFDAGLLIFGFRHVGLAIEESIKKNIGIRLMFKDRLPAKVSRVQGSSLELTALDKIEPGHLLRIQPGQLIPVDGVCEVEHSAVLETIVTGSPWPRQIVQGEPLLAGMYLSKDAKPLILRVSMASKHSYLAILDEHIARANDKKAPLEMATTRMLQYFIPGVIVVAILSFGLIAHFFTMALALGTAISVLVSACPCTLGLVTPLAVKIGMNKAAEHGVQFKTARHLQEGSQIDTVVFDLRGTLTKGVPSVNRCEVMPDAWLSRQELLFYFYVLEKKSSHPIAKAICEYVAEDFKSSIAPLPGDEETLMDTSNHSGIRAKIKGDDYVIGNSKMMEDCNIDVSQTLQCKPSIDIGDSIVYLARAKKIIGYMVLSDPLRADAVAAVKTLQQRGINVKLCTGEEEATARRYGLKIGCAPEDIYANCAGSAAQASQRNKVAFIEQLKRGRYRVAMVGDAANDAAAIATSHFGIAIKSHGSDEVTVKQAGAVIQSGALMPVVSALVVSKQTVSNIKQNLWVSLGYNVFTLLITGGLLLALGVTLSPSIGVALMIVQTCLILLNAYRFKKQPLTHLKQGSVLEESPSTSSHERLKASMPKPAANAPKPAISASVKKGSKVLCELPFTGATSPMFCHRAESVPRVPTESPPLPIFSLNAQL